MVIKLKDLLKEASETYFNSFSDAADAARKYAEKKGYTIDEDDWQTQVAMGGQNKRSRPSIGKTTRFTVSLTKNGKQQRKALQIQVYGMENGKYELNTYIN